MSVPSEGGANGGDVLDGEVLPSIASNHPLVGELPGSEDGGDRSVCEMSRPIDPENVAEAQCSEDAGEENSWINFRRDQRGSVGSAVLPLPVSESGSLFPDADQHTVGEDDEYGFLLLL